MSDPEQRAGAVDLSPAHLVGVPYGLVREIISHLILNSADTLIRRLDAVVAGQKAQERRMAAVEKGIEGALQDLTACIARARSHHLRQPAPGYAPHDAALLDVQNPDGTATDAR